MKCKHDWKTKSKSKSKHDWKTEGKTKIDIFNMI